MNIIRRNLFRLLRAGAYGSDEQLEPMSAWKWRMLCSQADALGLQPTVYDGMTQCSNQFFFMQMPPDQMQRCSDDAARASQHYAPASSELAELMTLLGSLQLRPVLVGAWATAALHRHPEHQPTPLASIFFPFATQGKKADEWAQANGSNCQSPRRHLLRYRWKGLQVEHRHRLLQLNNKLNNGTLQDIVEKERLECGMGSVVVGGVRMETLNPTLTMLATLLDVVRTSLAQGLQLWQIIDLGVQLRQQGDRIDFLKLQGWIEQLHFSRMAQLVATALTSLLGFTADEVPFVQPSKIGGDIDDMAEELLRSKAHARYWRYNPGEGFASIVASIAHKLNNVKE